MAEGRAFRLCSSNPAGRLLLFAPTRLSLCSPPVWAAFFRCHPSTSFLVLILLLYYFPSSSRPLPVG